MTTKYSAFSLLFLFVIQLQAQNNGGIATSTEKWEAPVENYSNVIRLDTFTVYLQHNANDSGLIFISNKPQTVHSVDQGKVETVIKIDSLQYFIAIKSKEVLVSYYPVAKSPILQGDKIAKGQFLGVMCKDENDLNYELFLKALNRGSYFSPFTWIDWKK